MNLKRTLMCGAVLPTHIHTVVTVNGWVHGVREFGGLVFVDLRDREGIVQLVFDKDGVPALHERAKRLSRECVIAARGRVVARGERQINRDLPTGEVEIMVSDMETLNSSETPPIEVRDDLDADPEIRLRYRFLDLRRHVIQRRFKLRHRVVKAARDYMDSMEFYEIETPLLTRPTPEGARDFLVPARLHPGDFYALPQSPQIFKQILMMSGFERYFQFARCFRDEDKRGDRQPEHTQLDMEMSFVEPADVHAVIEGCVRHVMKEALGIEIPAPFPHIPYIEAMARYGSDKPDTRFALELHDVSGIFAQSGFDAFRKVVEAGGLVQALRVPNGNELVSKGQFKTLEKDARGKGAKGLGFIRYLPDGGVDSPIAKFLSEGESATLRETTGARPGDMVFLVADTKHVCGMILGGLRTQFGGKLGLVDQRRFDYLWVDNFPQFEYDPEKNLIIPAHHPFVAPVQEDALIALAEELRRAEHRVTPPIVDLALSITATQYDLVVNGVELGSGSQRIVKKTVQDAMFECLGLTPEQAEAKFGFLLRALRYGAPPMAGIGIGLDRWLMVMLGLDSIQEVIVFPKSSGGKGLLDDSPSAPDPNHLKELGVNIVSDGKTS